MNNMNKILGTNLKVVDCYRTEDADMVVVILGSAAGVIKDVVDYYRDVKGYKIGWCAQYCSIRPAMKSWPTVCARPR